MNWHFRLARTSLALAALSTIWFVVNLVHPVGPAWLLWATAPAYGPLLTAVFWLTARSAPLPAESRRLWRHLLPVPLLVSAGQATQALDMVLHPAAGDSHLTLPMLTLDGVGVVLVIHAMGRLPLGAGDRGTAARIVLDAATVALASTTFIWHFSTRRAFAEASGPRVFASTILIVLSVLCVAAGTKVLLSGYRAIDPRGLRLLTAAIMVGAMAPMVQPLLPDGRLFVAQFHMPWVFTLAAYAAASQWSAAGTRKRRGRRRPYSVLPYAAVAAVDVLLLEVVLRSRDDVAAVAAGAVALTVLVAIRQLTALRDNARLLERVDHLANHDALTGLANRALMQRRLAEAGTATVALLDLDDFKQVNDTLGHEAGDQLLIAMAERLTSAVRPADTVARLGGDEFVVVLDGAGRKEADEVAQRLVTALAAPASIAGHSLPLRVSIGLATGSDDGAGTLLRRADLAMYAAKKLPGTAFLHYEDRPAGCSPARVLLPPRAEPSSSIAPNGVR